jgi:hypothetical protein
VPCKRCGVNGSVQHLLEVYSQESENLESFAGVDLDAVLPCPGRIEHSWTGPFSRGEVLSDQLIRWCCIEQLSWQRL